MGEKYVTVLRTCGNPYTTATTEISIFFKRLPHGTQLPVHDSGPPVRHLYTACIQDIALNL